MTRFSLSVLAAALIVLLSCQGGVSRFQFAHQGGTIRLREKPGVKTSEEGTIPTSTYLLSEPYIIERNDQALSLLYSAVGRNLTVSILAGRNSEPRVYDLPSNQGRKTEARVALDPGTVIAGFQIDFKGEEGKGELFHAGIDDEYPGIRFFNDHILQGSTVRSGDEQKITLPAQNGEAIVIEYQFSGDVPVELIVSNADSEDEKMIRLKPSGSDHPLYLYREFLAFSPDTIEVDGDEQRDFRLLSVMAQNKGKNQFSEPLTADLTTILFYDQTTWRRPEFELYNWNAYPEILIFDTKNYIEQARMFKRLAFFVEKEGFIGSLLSNEELEGKHGWNAHDYRAEDLALFFQTAATSGFPLNAEEALLQEILIENGVLIDQSGILSSGRGGVISLSRQSPEYLRRKFIIHEGTHGIFFTDPSFRETCFSLWETLSPDEKAFWKLFFAWNTYSQADRYLLANEYQAYLLQQTVEQAESYFRNHGAVRWMQRTLGSNDARILFLNENPGIFETRAREMDEAFFAVTGFRAGDLFSVEIQ